MINPITCLLYTSSKEKQHENYKDWSEYREGSFVWSDMIKRDLDACILQANDFSGFLELLSEKGYEVKQGKYLACLLYTSRCV